MKTIVAIGASNSQNSINKKLATWAANQTNKAQVETLDLNDFEMPIYSVDRENESGIPRLAQEFKNKILAADGVVISFAEHNGSYTAAFKNIVDWVSRLEGTIWENTPALLLATSPGARGGMGVLSSAKMTFPYQGAIVQGTFSLPSFYQNFKEEEGISDLGLLENFKIALNNLESAMEKSSAEIANG